MKSSVSFLVSLVEDLELRGTRDVDLHDLVVTAVFGLRSTLGLEGHAVRFGWLLLKRLTKTLAYLLVRLGGVMKNCKDAFKIIIFQICTRIMVFKGLV